MVGINIQLCVGLPTQFMMISALVSRSHFKAQRNDSRMKTDFGWTMIYPR